MDALHFISNYAHAEIVEYIGLDRLVYHESSLTVVVTNKHVFDYRVIDRHNIIHAIDGLDADRFVVRSES